MGERDQARAEFDELVRAGTDQLMRVVYLICRDAGRTEDVVQETWLRIAQRWPRVRQMASPRGYAYRIAVNLALSERRRSVRGPATAERAEAWPDREAETALRTVEDRAELRDALADLTPRQRAVLVLRYWEGRPEADVADLLGCSTGTVKSTASRALAAVRARLDGIDVLIGGGDR